MIFMSNGLYEKIYSHSELCFIEKDMSKIASACGFDALQSCFCFFVVVLFL